MSILPIQDWRFGLIRLGDDIKGLWVSVTQKDGWCQCKAIRLP